MNVEGRMGYPRRAELYLELLGKEVEVWNEHGAFPQAGRPEPGDVIALLIHPHFKQLLKQAGRDSGEPYWERFQDLDIPVPVVVFRSLEDEYWVGLKRDDFEALFTTLRERGWSPSEWGEKSLN